MIFGLLFFLACLMGALQIFLRRRIRHSATHFVRTGKDLNLLPPVERWTLAAIAPDLMLLELPVDSLMAPEFRRVPTISSVLTRDWGIKDRASLLSVISHLRSNGHRAHCSTQTGRPATDFLGWDLIRVTLLAWAGLNLEWVSYPEFTVLVSSVGSELQSAFPSWQDAADSYEAGLAIWVADGKVRKIAHRKHLAVQTLLQHPDSPWKAVPWQTPLVATIAE